MFPNQFLTTLFTLLEVFSQLATFQPSPEPLKSNRALWTPDRPQKQAMGKADWRGVDSEIAISCKLMDKATVYQLVVENKFAYSVSPGWFCQILSHIRENHRLLNIFKYQSSIKVKAGLNECLFNYQLSKAMPWLYILNKILCKIH